MDHFSMELRVDSLASDSRAAVILGGASHFTVKWRSTVIPLSSHMKTFYPLPPPATDLLFPDSHRISLPQPLNSVSRFPFPTFYDAKSQEKMRTAFSNTDFNCLLFHF